MPYDRRGGSQAVDDGGAPTCRRSGSTRWRRSYAGGVRAVDGVSLDDRERRVHGARRPVRLRQVDAAPHDRRARGGHRRRDLDRRPRGRRASRRATATSRWSSRTTRSTRTSRWRRTSATASRCGRRRRTRSSGASRRSRACSGSRSCSSGARARSRAASASASRWAARSSASRPRSSWTSRSRTSTRSCASTCAPSSRASTTGSAITTVYVTHDQVEAMTLGTRVAVMRDGTIQQVDTPQTLYREPVEPLRRRVHRLAVDEPRRGRARGRRGRVRRLPAAARADRRPAGVASGTVILGIRPQDFEDAPRADPALPTIEVEAAVVEELGSATHVLFTIDAPPVDVDRCGRQPTSGERATLLATDRRALFTAEVAEGTAVRPGDADRLARRPAPPPLLRPGHGRAPHRPRAGDRGLTDTARIPRLAGRRTWLMARDGLAAKSVACGRVRDAPVAERLDLLLPRSPSPRAPCACPRLRATQGRDRSRRPFEPRGRHRHGAGVGLVERLPRAAVRVRAAPRRGRARARRRRRGRRTPPPTRRGSGCANASASAARSSGHRPGRGGRAARRGRAPGRAGARRRTAARGADGDRAAVGGRVDVVERRAGVEQVRAALGRPEPGAAAP